MTTTAKVTNADSANGYIAIVERDGAVAYNSEIAHRDQGIFAQPDEAQAHADAWASRLLEIPGQLGAHKADVAIRTCEEGAILTGQLRDDATALDTAKRTVKAFKDSIDQRRERLEDIQGSPARAGLKVVWVDRNDPLDVRIVPKPTELDEPFEVQIADDPRQMSLPEMNWAFTEDPETGIVRAAGYGRITMRREESRLIITLGADEHEIVAELVQDGDVWHTRGRADAPKPEPVRELVVFKCGKLKDKPLRARLDMPELTRPETIIGVYKLEIERKPSPRKRVVEKLEGMMHGHKTHEADLVMAWTEIDAGREPDLDVDVAAAAIVTATDEELAAASDQWLEQAVAECGDPLALSWLIDVEHLRGDEARDHVITVATERLRSLGLETEDLAEAG